MPARVPAARGRDTIFTVPARRLKFASGTQASYSNLGCLVLGEVIAGRRGA